MFINVDGFILSEVDYKESSKILNILTKEYGVIGVISNGCKKVKSHLRSVSIKFTYARFYIKYKDGKASTLISAEIIDVFKNIRNDFTSICYMSYLSDLTKQVYNESKESLVFDYFIECIKKLDNNLDPLVLSNILEIKYLTFLGVEIDISSLNDIDYLSKKSIELIKVYKDVSINNLSNIIIEKDISEEINNFIKSYYDDYTGIYLYKKNYIEKYISV